MIIFGIDPGVSGAISILENKKVIDIFDMPTMIDGKKNKKQVNGSQVTNIIKERLKDGKEIIDVPELSTAASLRRSGVVLKKEGEDMIEESRMQFLSEHIRLEVD